MRTVLRIVSTLAALAAFLHGPAQAAIVNTVVDVGDTGRYSSVQLNASGFAVISYHDATNGDLKVAVCADRACTSATITTVDTAGTVGLDTSLALNASGFPVISYYDATNQDLKLAVCNNAACTAPTISLVDSVGNVGQGTSLKLNASGFPVISYGRPLKVAVCGNATCTSRTISTVDPSGTAGFSTSLQLDASGFPVIAYSESTADDLKLAVCGDAVCGTSTIITLDSAGNVGGAPSLLLNAGGFPVVSYLDTTNSNLKLAVCNDATCSAPTLRTVDNSVGVSGAYSALLLKPGDIPLIAFASNSPPGVRLATCADATCSTSTLATLDSNSLGHFVSARLDATGRPVISHYTQTGPTSQLKLVTFAPAAVTSVAVPANGTYAAGQNLDFRVNWSEPVVVDTTGGTPRIALTIGATTRFASYVSGSGTAALTFRYTVVAPDTDTDGNIVGALSANGGTIRDALGFDATLTLNAVGSTVSVFVDTTAPTVTVDQAPGQVDPATTLPITFRVVFSEPVTGFDAADVSTTGTTAGPPYIVGFSGSGATYDVTVSGMSSNGVVVVSVPAGGAVDAAGNANLASTSTDNTVTLADPAPTVTINQALGQVDPATGSPIIFTVVFSETVTGFTSADVSLAGSTAGGTLVAAVSGVGPTYTVTVTGMTTSGNVVASIPAGAAQDSFGGSSLASTSTDNTVGYVDAAPTVTINQAVGQVDPAGAASPVTFSVAFSEAVTGFTGSDVSFTGSTVGGTLTASVTGSGANYAVSVTGMSGNGNLVASIPAAAAQDAVGNPSIASTSTDNTVTIDGTAPTVTLNQASAQSDPASAAPITFTVVFSEAVTGFTGADVSFTGSTAAGPLAATVTGAGPTYTISVSGMTGNGTVVASIPAAAANDLAGNASPASTSTDNSVAYTGAATIVTTYTAPSATGTGNITASFTGGGATCSFSGQQFIGMPPGGPPLPPTAPPGAIGFPHGLFAFTTINCTPGSTLAFTITYPQALPPGTQYWKYGPEPGNATPHWYVLPATVTGTVATFNITDGAQGDDDLAANGTIVDQGGPGSPIGASAQQTPTLSEWAMLLLALLMVGVAMTGNLPGSSRP